MSWSKAAKWVLVAAAIFAAFGYGMIAGAYKLPPFPQFKAAKDALTGEQEAGPYNPRKGQFALFAPDVRYVMIGDSLIEAGQWHDFFPGASIANRGIGRETTGQIRRRLDSILATKPKTAFIMAGMNDVSGGVPQDRTLANYRAIVRGLRGAGAAVVVQSTVECRDCGPNLGRVRALNAELAELAREEGAIFINLAPIMSGEDGLRAEYTYDGTHLTAEGYDAWIEALGPYFEPQLAE